MFCDERPGGGLTFRMWRDEYVRPFWGNYDI